MGLTMQRCVRCDHVRFPPAALCPRCHAARHDDTVVDHGVVEEITAQAGTPPLIFASVRSDAGPVVMARLVGPIEIGDHVTLSTDTRDDGEPRAVVPAPLPERTALP